MHKDTDSACVNTERGGRGREERRTEGKWRQGKRRERERGREREKKKLRERERVREREKESARN